jgi:hypothetical protein
VGQGHMPTPRPWPHAFHIIAMVLEHVSHV